MADDKSAATVTAEFSDADFLEKPLSHKVHCTAPALSTSHPHYVAWDAEEHFILNWLRLHTLTPEFADTFPHQATVKGFWDQANLFCGKDGDNWRLLDLVDQAYSLRQGSMSIMEYALAHKRIWDEVDHYLPPDTSSLMYQHTLRLRLLGFIRGLNREYEHIRCAAMYRTKGLPTIFELVKELQEEESHILKFGRQAFEDPRDSTALLSRASSTPASTQEGAAPVCSYCSKIGHVESRCRKKYFAEQKKKKKKESALLAQSTSGASQHVTAEQFDRV
ncbi:uncharacterized protein LOC144716405 [Wolffia australiana]